MNKTVILFLAFLLVLHALQQSAHAASSYSVELYGQGDEDVKALFDAWGQTYRAARDDITLVYDVAPAEEALAGIHSGQNDFINLDAAVDESDPDSIEQYGSTFQVPIAAQGLVFTYNLAATVNPATDPRVVLDLKALADIFMGDIRLWSDPYIATLNPQLAAANKLPALNISLAFIPGDGLDISEPLKRALPPYHAGLGQAIDNAEGDLGGLVPALEGRWVSITDQAERLAFVAATQGAMTYIGSADALRASLVSASLVNKAGTTLQPTLHSVAAAVSDFATELNSGDSSIDIVDAPGNESYPLAYISYISLPKNLTGASVDCSLVVELLRFFSWTQTNQRALDVLTELGYTSFGDAGRKRLIDTLGQVQCKGEQAFELAILIGVGAPLAEFAVWTTEYSGSDDDDKLHYYFASTESTASEVSLENVDFAITAAGLNATEFPDVTILPAAAVMVVAAYNVPALGDVPLVLNLSVIADIYLGNVERWNDSKIVELNPELANLLPPTKIVVLVMNEPSEITRLFTGALAKAVPGWSEAVGVSDLATFPVSALSGRTVSVTAATLPVTLKSTQSSFTFWTPLQVQATRSARIAHLVNNHGRVVTPSQAAVNATVREGFDVHGEVVPSFLPILDGEGEESWPIVAWASFLLHLSQDDCNKMRGLIEFVYWSQTSETALEDLERTYGVSASAFNQIKRFILLKLEELTCNGEFMVPFQRCLIDGTLCSDRGKCSEELGTCFCDTGRAGTHCEYDAASSSDALVIGLGVGLPVGLMLLLLIVLAAIVLWLVFGRRKEKDEWEVDFAHEVELGALLGTGGFGQVYRATWKGTEVAVKKMVSASKEMERSFRDEVRVMTALRHPNVVLFMGACTRAPTMCIIMEYMALGSLYELLHNELVPEIPHELKCKMAYQAAKGMHFLHSSGIVHRDLKSLNLLLDNKWNLKVSDFGLTTFKEDMKKGQVHQMQGSIHWTAPEILNEYDNVDYVQADVYSFGIVLWEILSRQQPYEGLSLASVAVAVIRDGMRPAMPEDTEESDFTSLITTCWHQDPGIRPTFLEVMTRLSAMLGDSSGFLTSKTSSGSSSSSDKGVASSGRGISMSRHTGIPLSSTSSSSSSNSGRLFGAKEYHGGVRAPPPEDVTIVFTDVARASSLWEFDAQAMRDATLLHNTLMRRLLKEHRGYEAAFTNERNSGEGSFCMAFASVPDALAWCTNVQQQLLLVEWPDTLLSHPGAAEEWGHTDDRVIFKGLRVRMGINVGSAGALKDVISRRVEYVGPTVNAAARITALTHGGQIVISQATYERYNAHNPSAASSQGRFVCLGSLDQPTGAKLYEFKVEGLEARFFGGNGGVKIKKSGSRIKTRKQGSARSSDSSSSSEDGGSVLVGEGMAFREDNFLTSANLCRWIIDFKELQMGKQVGIGSYGIVFQSRWKGVDVAVKRFIKQRLDERHMLEFRAEMALLSELHHPNIVLFIGACVKAPNLCIVTEFVRQGDLREILSKTTMKLEWALRMRMLRSAALGIMYLHSLDPVIVHRDLKSSNLLVDENWNVKVADFGFARIKEDNATMTRCGTPCWTAPEIIRGQSYSEKADVYSFGIIMWEVITRKHPFATLNFMGVSLDVLEGKRPHVPGDCPRDLAKLMAKCWHDKPTKRPSMEDVVSFFDRLAAAQGDDDLESSV